ncbi:glycoside hydrolase [Teratosphaeria nubilosa]|uniref:cellulase n=1 Tax=Teratosphaeria nubilosa TaxID=161662 RepID=A0A6G1LC93_9PEZI|nr:glycoside hydrolase [Teratosphaeria nubilosa]
MASPRLLALLALTTGLASLTHADVSGIGTTTRFWDCCKPSCAWPNKAPVSGPVKSCSKHDSPIIDANAASSCQGGEAHMCTDQSPWVVSDNLAYGFAAVHIPGGSEQSWCCACFELTFTSGPVKGKKMVVQATNTGGDLGQGQFDLAIPGGGVGIFNSCSSQWGAPSSGWGAQYGGISSDTCSSFPTALRAGCGFRFGDFWQNADNPTVEFKQVPCPKALTDKTGCVRNGETPTE